jgi:cytochrome c-type biogenesis protein CcmH/NrfF
VVFVSLGIAVLLLQNFYLLSSFKQLLNNVTVAQLPDQTQMVPYPYNSGPSTEPTAPNANNATKNNPYENDAAMLFAALMTPCKKCNRPLASNDCDHPHGAKVTKELIYQMLAAGKGKSEIVGYFVKTYGIDVLTPQAKAIYQQRHKNS